MDSGIECPTCGIGTLTLTNRLVVHPLGSFSLAGCQDKVTATDTPALVCSHTGCDFVLLAKRVDGA